MTTTSENEAWIMLFRRLPAHLQEALALGLTTGAEIVLQRIVKLEPDFMIVRGRLAGTQDTGRVVMIPYNQLTFVAIQRDLKDVEVEAVFGKGAPVAAADLPSAPVETTPAEPTPEEATVNEAEAPVNPVKKKAEVSKTSLVAKLRDRLKEPGK